MVQYQYISDTAYPNIKYVPMHSMDRFEFYYKVLFEALAAPHSHNYRDANV